MLLITGYTKTTFTDLTRLITAGYTIQGYSTTFLRNTGASNIFTPSTGRSETSQQLPMGISPPTTPLMQPMSSSFRLSLSFFSHISSKCFWKSFWSLKPIKLNTSKVLPSFGGTSGTIRLAPFWRPKSNHTFKSAGRSRGLGTGTGNFNLLRNCPNS